IDLGPENPQRAGQIVAISEQPAVAAVIAPDIGSYLSSVLQMHRTGQLVASTVAGSRVWQHVGLPG
ncbi:MAG: hypothetical protein K0Q72_3598, partial [Armatimonadetes bacterium]|nr:hypothetical protein [Armatimonadota bacterium]